MEFTDAELENYFRLQRKAEEYLNNIIRLKRVQEYYKDSQTDEDTLKVSEVHNGGTK